MHAMPILFFAAMSLIFAILLELGSQDSGDGKFIKEVSERFETFVMSSRNMSPNLDILENLQDKEKLFIYNPIFDTKNEYAETISGNQKVGSYSYEVFPDEEDKEKLFLRLKLSDVRGRSSCKNLLLEVSKNYMYKTVTVNGKDVYLRDSRINEEINDICEPSRKNNYKFIDATLTTYSI